MDVAFSRDQDGKVYVQHRLLERGREVYGWLEEGAHFYVCGDANGMAPDVHAALVTILGREGGLAPEQAEDYLKRLQREKRYKSAERRVGKRCGRTCRSTCMTVP